PGTPTRSAAESYLLNRIYITHITPTGQFNHLDKKNDVRRERTTLRREKWARILQTIERGGMPRLLLLLHFFLNLSQDLDRESAVHVVAVSVKPIVQVANRHTHEVAAADFGQLDLILIDPPI